MLPGGVVWGETEIFEFESNQLHQPYVCTATQGCFITSYLQMLFGMLVYNKSFSNKAPDYVKCAILADPIRPLVQCMTQQGN